MAQDIVNENQKISYTNLDFSSIYTEVIDLIKQLTYRWDPSISDESDPGVILVKLSSLIADKCNYNIDKNILETFPLSVTQNGNARQLYDQLGYYMNWYESASVPVLLNWIGDTSDSSISYTIPKFTHITDAESSVIYSIIGAEGVDDVVVSDIIIPADGKTVTVIAMEGTATQYQFENEIVITAQMVDPISRRLYFPHSYVSQNGIFIKNTKQENYASWKRVNNLYENSYNELRYIFGYDSNSNTCFLEFPDNYAELFGSGIEITYLVISEESSNIPAQYLNQFLAPMSIEKNNGVILDSSNVKISNFLAASGHKNIEDIDEAYINYKRTVGTFKTLITLRDYLNYIRSQDLDICSNAFVCDRTNDIQSTYKIMSNQHDLDTLIVKVEQIIDELDESTNESTFDYKFIKTNDISVDPNKTYYKIINDTIEEVTISGSPNPKEEGWYELESIEPKTKDALSPFSLKFYLLRKAIALNSKTAYNQTFSIMKPYPDFDTLLEDTSHLEHVYEDLLPLGENTYKKSQDESWLETKSYWLYNSREDSFTLISDTSTYDTPPKDNSNVYEIDVEALLPHTIMFKGIYPLVMNISTYNILDEDTQANISSNIINSLYANVNSSQVDFGLPISIDYLSTIAKNSDDRIKDVTISPIEYSLYATYYDKDKDNYIDVKIDNNIGSFTPDSYRNIDDIVSTLIKKDIVCKSILAGTTQLIVPDSTFIYHLSQKYVSYVDEITNITGEAIIDIQNDSVTSYSLYDSDSFIRKSYTLKDNEIVSLYRPHFEDDKIFSNNIHFEYVFYNKIEANSSYKLLSNEYFIAYMPVYDTDNSIITGYTAYACGPGAVIKTTFDIEAQNSISALSRFARTNIITYFTVNPSKTYYETSTYNETYKTEIRNNSAIINNAISGTNEIRIERASTLSFERDDKYKFFWILNEPTYSNNSNLKTYTLFNNFDSVNDSQYSETINSYTLKNGELLLYTNDANTDFEALGPGTTIIRNCGVETSYYTQINNSIYFLDTEDTNILNDASFSFLTDDHDQIMPFGSGLFEVFGTPNPRSMEEGDNPFALNLYEQEETTLEDETTIIKYIPTDDTEVDLEKNYYEPTFIRSTDVVAYSDKSYYVLAMRKQAGCYSKSEKEEDGVKKDIYTYDELDTGCFKEYNLYPIYNEENINEDNVIDPSSLDLYEIVSYENDKVIDTYPLNSYVSATEHNRFTSTLDTSTINRNILTGTEYEDLKLNEIDTYTNINMDNLYTSDTKVLKLLSPVYKTYYTRSGSAPDYTYTATAVDYLSNPAAENLYEKNSSDQYLETSDTEPVIESIRKTSDVSLFKEINSLYSVNTENMGYYYKPCSLNSIYYAIHSDTDSFAVRYRPSMDASVVLKEYEGVYNRSPLQFLFSLFLSTTQPDDLSGSTQLEEISSKWLSTYTYQKPFIKANSFDSSNIYYYDDVVIVDDQNALGYKCIVASTTGPFNSDEWVPVNTCWGAYAFEEHLMSENPDWTSDLSGKYIKVSSESIIDRDIFVNSLYPAFDDSTITNSCFFISAEFYTDFENEQIHELADSTHYYTFEFESDGITHVFNWLDTDKKLAQLFPNHRNDISNYGNVRIYFLPKLYKFNDFVRYTYKNYYTVKELYDRNCGEIKAWTCTALDSDSIINNPIKDIGDLWATLQSNTSLTIIQNDISSFATGDTLIFEANESSESYVKWPVFSNKEIILDLDSYKVSYQRVGENIQSLDTVAVDDYKWRGYSSLMLNTSSTSGQKLEDNHSLKLYDSDIELNPIAVLSGDSEKNITFQLKYPVENRLGTFIDVSSTDMLGENISNTLYAFIPIPNGTYYAYNTNDYRTYLYFNSSSDEQGNGGTTSTTYSPRQIQLPIGLPKGNYLLGMDMKDGINLTIDYMNVVEDYSIDAVAEPISDISGALDNMLYTIKNDYHNYLHSYVDESRYIFTKNKYDYINLIVESEYRKVTLPSCITYELDKSPYELGWYIKDENDDSYSKTDEDNKGSDLLVRVDQSDYPDGANPKELGWYEEWNEDQRGYYSLSSDTTLDIEKIYYKEPDLYVNISDISSYLNFDIGEYEKPTTYTILDIFKYENNPDLGDDFDIIRDKIKQLDVDEEYNYIFKPTSNDLIKNPLDPQSFWNPNHVYNQFIIPQLNFDEDNISFRYITTKMNK